MAELLLAYIVFLGALASPGPDFLIVMRNALGYTPRAGIFTAAGIAAALIIHFTYCVAGIGLVISRSILLFNVIKWLGAGYLIYVGIGALRSRGSSLRREEITEGVARPAKSDRQAFINGFVTNLFNPKATMFFLALFSQMISPQTATGSLVVFSALCMTTAFAWFSLVSVVMGIPAIRRGYEKASRAIDRLFGLFFIGLGARLAFARAG